MEEELKQLERKLKAAHFAKLNAFQRSEKESQLQQEKVAEKAWREYEKKLLEMEEEKEKEKEKEAFGRKLMYKEELLKQMKECEKRKYIDVEPVKVDAVSGNFHEISKEHSIEIKRFKQQELKSSLDACLEINNRLKSIKLKEDLVEEQKRQQIAAELENKRIQSEQRQKEVEKQREAVQTEVAKKWMEEREKVEKRETALCNAEIFEISARNEQDIIAEKMNKKIAARKALLDQMKQNFENIRAEHEIQQKEEKAILESIEKAKAEERAEKEKAAAKKNEYRDSLKSMLYLNEQKRKREKEEEMEREMKRQWRDSKRMQILTELRKTLLVKNGHLVNFLPSGTLKQAEIRELKRS